MIKQNVLFIDTAHPALIEGLSDAGFHCDEFPGRDRAAILNSLEPYFGLVIRSKIKLDREAIDRAPHLKFIARVGAGLENIDVSYAQSKGIVCINSPEGNRDAVGEHALAMLLMLLNHLGRADAQVRKGIWIRAENRGTEIKGKTVGIIGYGNMGSAFAQRLMGFDARIIAYDKYKTGFGNEQVEEVALETLFREADILSLHVPFTPETEYMVNSAFLERFQNPLYLINTARGKVVKTADLVAQMQAGKVLGAALDVLEYEKLSFENLDAESLPADFKWLIDSDRVVFSPHIGGWTHESHYKLSQVIVDKVLATFGASKQ